MVIQSSYIQQPHVISPGIGGFIDFWSNGVRAASTHITMAKYAVDAGMPLNHFVGVTGWSLKLLWRISNEYFSTYDRRENYNSHTEFQLDRFEHDVLNRRLTTLNNEWSVFDSKGRDPAFLYKKVSQFYHFSPDLHTLVGGLISRIASLYSDMDFTFGGLINDMARYRGVRNGEKLEDAQIILENLIDNAIKHAEDGRVRVWVDDKGDTIIIGDGNGGLDQAHRKNYSLVPAIANDA